MKKICVLLWVAGVVNCYYGGTLEKELAKAKKSTGKIVDIIPLSKNNKSYDKLNKFIQSIKRGNIVRIYPGKYNDEYDKSKTMKLILDEDNIIIEGDDIKKLCNINLVLEGKNIIVRNINIRSLECNDAIIINSIIGSATFTNGGRSVEQIAYNSCFSHITIYPNNSSVHLKNCTILSSVKENTEQGQWKYNATRSSGGSLLSIGKMNQKGEIIIEDSVLNTNGSFLRTSFNLKLLRIKLRNSLIYAKNGCQIRGNKLDDIKAIKKYCPISFGNINTSQAQLLHKTPMHNVNKLKYFLFADGSYCKKYKKGFQYPSN